MSYKSQTHFGNSILNTSIKDGERTPQSNITQNFYSIDEVVKTDEGLKLVPIKNKINEKNRPNIKLEFNFSKGVK